MKKYLFCLMLSSALFALNPAQAMERDELMLEVPENFPGHASRPIQGVVKIPDSFNPADYQQNKSRAEGACTFNSLLAGIMHTEYGRSKVQALLKSQDEMHVNIQFYFPEYNIVKEFEEPYYTWQTTQCKKDLHQAEHNLRCALTREGRDEVKIQKFQERVDQLKDDLRIRSIFWERALNASETVVKVPKKFVTRDKASFPHDNPDWLNLVQQAYMLVTKNYILRMRDSTANSYSIGEKIIENDVFCSIPLCNLDKGRYGNIDSVPRFLNIIDDTMDASRKFLRFFPLLDISLKKLVFFPDKEKGVDLEKSIDVHATALNGQPTYAPIWYNTITEFTHRHGLSKDFFMANNVVQIEAAGHAVALFFGQGKVMYYDNVLYPHSSQISVYGKIGPIYEEGHYFEGLSINAMQEEEFFTRFFKEINYRGQQIAQVRGQEFSYAFSREIIFFERSLVDR